MTPTEYPKRPSHFAHKAVRLMFKTCIAQEIGTEALTLLVAIAMTEDAKRYRGPVTYFNEQLMPNCGFRNVKALDRARRKAMSSGWLHYEPGTKAVAGRYWVTIPMSYEGLSDFPTDESPSEFQVDFDQASAREVGKNPGGIRQASGEESARQEGNIPPVPVLDQEEDSAELPKPAASVPTSPVLLTFPTVGKDGREWHLTEAKLAEYREAYPNLDVMAECRKALQWCRDNNKKRKTPRGMPAFLTRWLNNATDRTASRNQDQPKTDPASARMTADTQRILAEKAQRRANGQPGPGGSHHAAR